MKKLIIANWKMNPQTFDAARRLVSSLGHRMPNVAQHTEVVICAPYVFLPGLSQHLAGVKLGAQNISWADSGALTGEISGQHLRAAKVEYVILGHSERRIYFGETDSVVGAKIAAALEHKITPILCLGGEEGATKSEMKTLVTKQFNACIKDLEYRQLSKLVYVYEPTWAISTQKHSEPASGEHAAEMIEHIYTLLERHIGKSARSVRVLYGGTVNRDNVSEYAQFSVIDGALVGAASLDSENFWQIIKEFNREGIHRS